MRKYVDQIRTHDYGLAYTIMEALEKDGNYSVELYEGIHNDPTKNESGRPEYRIEVFMEIKLTPPPVGFCGDTEGCKCECNCEVAE